MHTVGLVVYPGFQALGLAVASVFEYTNLFRGERVYQFRLVSEDGGPVMTSQSFSVNTDRLRDWTYDTLIVAGDNDGDLPSPSLVDYVRHAPGHSRRVAAICTGGFVLAAAGLLEGKRATTHWFHAQQFRKQFPNVLLDEDRIFVVDGQITMFRVRQVQGQAREIARQRGEFLDFDSSENQSYDFLLSPERFIKPTDGPGVRSGKSILLSIRHKMWKRLWIGVALMFIGMPIGILSASFL